MTTTHLRRIAAVLALVLAAGTLAACDLDFDPIPGDGPLRYRDPIFSTVDKTADVRWRTAKNQDGTTAQLLVDIYRPAGDRQTRRPLIIFAHGGSFAFGDKDSAEIVEQARYFAQRGYVTASITYRLNQPGCTSISAACIQAIFDADQDGQAAVAWFRSKATTYGVDPTRIAFAGTSAGAIIAMGVAYGVSDQDGGVHDPAVRVRAGIALSGAAIFNNAFDAQDAPTLLFHGTNDPLVPYSWAEQTSRTANQHHLVSRLVTWPGDGHVPYYQHKAEILAKTTTFLYRHLDLARASTA